MNHNSVCAETVMLQVAEVLKMIFGGHGPVLKSLRQSEELCVDPRLFHCLHLLVYNL